MSVSAGNEVQPAWQNYLDLENDVKGWQQFPQSDVASDAKLQLVLDMACWWAQDYLGRPIAPTTFFRRFSGWTGLTGAYINLPYYPILEIESVVETWGLNGQHTLVYQTPQSQGGAGEQMYQVDWLTGTLIRTYQGLIQRPFFPGTRNIECTWVAGYDPVPPTFKIGTLELVKYWWDNVQQASRSAPSRGQEYGDQVIKGLWPAVPDRIAQMFSTGVQIGIG